MIRTNQRNSGRRNYKRTVSRTISNTRIKEISVNKLKELYHRKNKNIRNIIISENMNLVYFDDEYFNDIAKYSKN